MIYRVMLAREYYVCDKCLAALRRVYETTMPSGRTYRLEIAKTKRRNACRHTCPDAVRQ